MNIQDSVNKQILDARNSGLYSVASLDMFDTVTNLEIYEKLYKHLEYTMEILNEYLSEVMDLGDTKPGVYEFLKALRVGDVVDNQRLVEENSFLVGLYSQLSGESAMGRLIKCASSGDKITCMNMFEMHSMLLYGKCYENVSSIREDNNRFVGKYENSNIIFNYFPIDYHDVIEATDRIASLYNDRLMDERFNNVFFQPFLLHGLLAGLQIFTDGNTRMGRVMQHALMWQLINERTDFNFQMPPLFATRSYYPFRTKYREIIANLVTNDDNDSWNKWFDFNLDRIEDSIYANRENIKILKMKKNNY